jgi:hypothetical protein
VDRAEGQADRGAGSAQRDHDRRIEIGLRTNAVGENHELHIRRATERAHDCTRDSAHERSDSTADHTNREPETQPERADAQRECNGERRPRIIATIQYRLDNAANRRQRTEAARPTTEDRPQDETTDDRALFTPRRVGRQQHRPERCSVSAEDRGIVNVELGIENGIVLRQHDRDPGTDRATDESRDEPGHGSQTVFHRSSL